MTPPNQRPHPRQRLDTVSMERWLRNNGAPAMVRPEGRFGRPITVVATVLVVLAGLAAATFIADLEHLFGNPFALIAGLVVAGVVAYVVAALSLVRLAGFAFTWFLRTLVRGSSGLWHILPLLLVAVTFFFLAGETWQAIGRLRGLPLLLTFTLFISLGVVVLVRRARTDLDELGEFDAIDQVRGALPGDFDADRDFHYVNEPLRLVERTNLLLISVLGKAMVAVVVGLAVMLFFVLFGMLTIDADLAESWSGEPPRVYLQFTIGEHDYALTAPAVRVAGFLGTFSGLYFIVSASTDRELAQALSSGAVSHIRSAMAVRAVYRAAENSGSVRPSPPKDTRPAGGPTRRRSKPRGGRRR